MKFNFLTITILSALLFSCKSKNQSNKQEINQLKFQNKGHELVYDMTQKIGNYATLRKKKDVVYTYTYVASNGKTDISIEKYIFDGELSYGRYETHERTLANFEKTIEQGYDGNKYWLKHNGEIINDSIALKRVAFNRPTNFYWFTMFQKMLDPGLKYEYIGEKTIDNQEYDIVKVTFTAVDKPTDIYQLYINKKTKLVDQFLFTVADFGRMEIPNLMQIKYEEVDGILLPTTRQYKRSTWDAHISDDPWVTVKWTDIKFNNGIDKKDFME